MLIGGVKFENVEKILCVSPNNPVEQAFAGNKANDAAFVDNNDIIVIVKGDVKERRKKRKKITEDVREALDTILQ